MGSKVTDTKNDDKLREAIVSLGGTKGDVKYLENIDVDDSENLVTDANGQDEVYFIIELNNSI